MNDDEWIIEGVWRTDWSNKQARETQGRGEVHDQLEHIRQRREREHQQDINSREASQRISNERRGVGDD